MQEKLVEIRCPFRVTTKSGYTYTCNRLCVRVAPGSSGEAWCRACSKRSKMAFRFEVKSQNDIRFSVKVQKIPKSISGKIKIEKPKE